MKYIKLIISIFILSFMGCGILPHYEEKLIDSLSEDFKNVAFEQIWISAVDSIMEMDYKISNMDKAGGFIYAEQQSDGLAWPYPSAPGPSLGIVIKDLKEKVIVKCQIEGGIIKNPQEVIERFFSILKNKLKI